MDMKSFAAVVLEEFTSQHKAGAGKLSPRKTRTGFEFEIEWTDTADVSTKFVAQVTQKEIERFTDDEPEEAVMLVVDRLLEATRAPAVAD